jgi:pyruvate formate lyase activating enzyme
MKGLIFSVKRYSIHDGPGIRVTFFMKGCPLRCRWCHNPEGIKPEQETVMNRHRIGGKEFVKEEQVGTYYSTGDLLEILERERVFMTQSDGGVTFSGGEPMLQHAFLLEALTACRQAGYHTAVDTSGYAPRELYTSILPYTDLFLFDIKHLDEAIHASATGVSNQLIISNYLYLLENAREVNLRIPIIPGFNNNPQYITRLIEFITTSRRDSLRKINLLPFHRIGSSKYKKFGLPYLMDDVHPPEKDEMHELRERFLATGLRVKTGG